MRKILAFLLVALCWSAAGGTSAAAVEESPAASETPGPQDPVVIPAPAPVADKHMLFKKYVKDSLGTEGVLGAALHAGIAQVMKTPPSWELGTNGYMQRWASAYGQSAISDTTKYAVSRLLHQDPSYQRCECTGFLPRLGHAVSSPFMARNRDGEWVLSPAVAAGIFAGQVVPPATWYPSDHRTRDGFERSGTALLSKIGVRVFREFVPLPGVFQ